MEQADLVTIVLLVGGVLAVAAILIVGLLAMTVWLERRSARQESAIVTAWAAFGQSLGLAVERKGRHPPVLTGPYRGRALRITGSYGRNDNPGHTWATFKTDFPADVYLRKSRGRTLGVEYLPSGDAELDERFTFQSRPPGLLARAVHDPGLRQALSATDAWLTLDPRSVSSHINEVIGDPDQLRLMVEQAAEAADFVEHEIGVSIPQGRALPPDAYHDLNVTARIRLPRWAIPVGLALGLLALAACVCIALLPAATEIWKVIQGA